MLLYLIVLIGLQSFCSAQSGNVDYALPPEDPVSVFPPEDPVSVLPPEDPVSILPPEETIQFESRTDFVPWLKTTTTEPHVYSPGTHSIICAKAIRPGSNYAVSLEIYKELKGTFNLNITIVDSAQTTLVILAASDLTFDGIRVFDLKIPSHLSDSAYTILLVATGALEFSYSNSLTVNKKHLSIFIQTDKVLYQPGQTVLFRVVATDPLLKPINHPINIIITDNFGNRILDITQHNNSGVVTNSLKLSDQTPLGTWTIKASTQGQATTKTFEVAEYVLPKFEVSIDLPKFFLVNSKNPSQQKDLVATISAIYTYGKPVDGSATVVITLHHFWQQTKSIEKNLQLLDGKAQLVLTTKDLIEILPIGWSLEYNPTFLFTANVIEFATGIVLSANNTVACTTSKFNLNFLDISPNNFKPGLLYTAFMQLSLNDGSQPLLKDITDQSGEFLNIEVKSECNFPWNQLIKTPTPISELFILPLTESGYLSLEFTVPAGVSSCSLTANFFNAETNLSVTAYKSIQSFKTRDLLTIQVILLSSKGTLKPNSIAHFSIKSNHEITSFSYYILGKGQVYKSGSVNGAASINHEFEFEITEGVALDLAPELTIVVTTLTSNNELVADSITLTIVDYFANKVSLDFSTNSSLPGKEVILNVQAHPDSFVGLLAVDQSVLLLASGNDITKMMVMDDIKEYGKPTFDAWPLFRGDLIRGKRKKRCAACRFWWPFFPSGKDTRSILDSSGVFVLGDVYVYKEIIRFPVWLKPMNKVGIMGMAGPVENSAPSQPSDDSQPGDDKVRSDFPETWIWTDVIASSNGSYSYKVKVPDTMTSWVATAFATHPTAGLGIADQSAKIIVLKKFFVSLNLPYAVVRGEEFALQVTVFNYVEFDAQVTLALAKSTEFYVRNCSAVNETAVSKAQYAYFKVNKNSVATVYFWIVPVKTGYINIPISARALGSSDSMIGKLLVRPQGEPQSYSTSALIQVDGPTKFISTFNITLPATGTLVPDSVFIEVTLIGNIMGCSLSGLDNLLQMPYGCGEQNMLNFAPDVYIMLYLQYSNQATSDIAIKAKSFMNTGYQSQLTYQRDDGSFSAFGNSDKSGSVWLSAFVIKCFHQARTFIPVEDSKISRTLEWIITNQAANGSFHEPPDGRVIHTELQGGSASGVALTAYVLISLLENINVSQSTTASISKAIAYLETNYLLYTTSPYALSIIAYAFHLSGSNKFDDVMNKLNALAITAGGTQHWEETVTMVSNTWTPNYVRSHAVNIETTAYVLLTLSSKGDLSASIPIVRWLITQRNPGGGFASTQDTVVALEALAMFSRIMPGMKSGSGLSVIVSNNIGKPSYLFKNITVQNSLILQSYQVPTGTTKVTITGTGVGTGLVQMNVKYNVLNVTNMNLLSLNVQTSLIKSGLNLTICSSWNSSVISGMIVIEINLLTGYQCDYKDELHRQIGSILKRIDSDDSKIVLYLDELKPETLCFNLILNKNRVINNVQKTAIKVYRYYEPSTKIIKFYQPTTASSTNWFTTCPLCCASKQKII